jgi:sulfide:quinone oxidoreductase
MTKIVVLGGSFAGLTAAFELKRDLRERADVTLVSRDPRFVFIPSLIWVVPGWRKPGQISFEIEPVLRRRDIGFVHAVAEKIDPAAKKVVTDRGEIDYDYLVIATGPKYDWSVVAGLGPADGTTWSVCNLPHAMEAAKAWLDRVQDPGPVVIGATQLASCFGAEYEIAFNIDRALRQARIRDKVDLTFFTAEPFLGHFGIGGRKGGSISRWMLRPSEARISCWYSARSRPYSSSASGSPMPASTSANALRPRQAQQSPE